MNRSRYVLLQFVGYNPIIAHNFEKDCMNVKYDEIPAELEETAKNAARDCSVTAIYLKK
jgi:hypothetical protein